MQLAQDLRFSLRVLSKNPGFTSVAVIALALGVGANTAIFSVMDVILLRPLAYGDPDRLVRVAQVSEGDSHSGLGGHAAAGGPTSPGNFVDWQNQNKVFEDMSAYRVSALNLISQDEPQRLLGAYVTPNIFNVLKVKPLLGRTFQADDAMPDSAPVVVVSEGFFKRRFAADPKALGQPLNLDGKVYRLIGVMPAQFELGRDTELWVPLLFTPEDLEVRGRVSLTVIGRLAAGTTIAQARADLNAIAAHIQQIYPSPPWSVSVVSLRDQLIGNFKMTLFILLGAVGFVLLVACANVANLLLARAAERVREIAIRTALGASRARLIRQMLTESVLLGLLGGALGLVLASGCLSLLRRYNPGNIPWLNEVGLDIRVLAFTLGISLLTGLSFGLIPALQISQTDLYPSLKEGGAQLSAARGRQRLRSLLVVSEVALALVLLIGAGLMIRSFQLLLAVDPGFNPKNVLTLRMSLPASKYLEPYQRMAFLREILIRVQNLPAVSSAGLVTTLPMGGGDLRQMIILEGRLPTEGEAPAGGLDMITPDYFRTMGIPVLKGRPFTDQDRTGSPPVVILDENMANLYYPGENPVGKRLMIPGVQPVYREIVGVVKGVRFFGLEAERRPNMYVPLFQYAGESITALAVKTKSDPLPLANAVRGAIWSVDRDQPMSPAATMEELLDRSVAQRRFNTGMIEIFALLGLALAVVGVHGVLAYSVAQRTQEIGVRMALGADRDRVLRSVLAEALLMVGIGVIMGILGSIALTRLMASLLYGVSPIDLRTYIGMTILLISIALLASYLPARRATRIDPLIALRYE